MMKRTGIVALVCLVFAGCSPEQTGGTGTTGSDPTGDPPASTSTMALGAAQTTDAATVAAALDWYDRLELVDVMSRDDRWQLRRFQLRMEDQCLAAAGVDWPSQSMPATEAVRPVPLFAFWIGPHEDGYGITDMVTPADTLDALRESVTVEPPSLEGHDSDAYDRAMFGDPSDVASIEGPNGAEGLIRTGGCVGAVTRELYGMDVVAFRQARALTPSSDLVLSEVIESPEITEPLQVWARCMAEAGHPVASPSEIAELLATGLDDVIAGADPARLLADEATLAAAHTACDRSTGFTTEVAELFVQASSESIDANRHHIDTYVEALEHASAIMAEG